MGTTSSPLYPSSNGDLIIQTSDEMLFGVHILLLRLSSSVMNDMLMVGSGSGDRDTVTITEDSTIFQSLLSFIYPDQYHTIFTDLISLMPVLDAAAKYDMKGVVRSLSLQITKGVKGDPLMYQDPLWVHAKAKQLDLANLAKAAANATLTIDLGEAPRRPELANVPASWIFELVNLRTNRSSNILSVSSTSHDMCHQPFYRDRNEDYGTPVCKSVREIDFNRITKCLRCGAAIAAHYRKICLQYEKTFGEV